MGPKRLGARKKYAITSENEWSAVNAAGPGKNVHHSRRADYTLRQFDDEDWRVDTNDANNGRDAARVTTTTRTDSHLKIQQPPKPLPPPEPPPPQPWRPRPGTATGNHVRQRTANHHQSSLTLLRLRANRSRERGAEHHRGTHRTGNG